MLGKGRDVTLCGVPSWKITMLLSHRETQFLEKGYRISVLYSWHWGPWLNDFELSIIQNGLLKMAQWVKNPPANAGDTRDEGLIPGLGRAPGEGNGNPLQYSCLENPMDGGAWWALPWGHKRVGRG